MKYTEKEKKAIENVKIILNSNIRNPFLDDEADSIDILLNLLEMKKKLTNIMTSIALKNQ